MAVWILLNTFPDGSGVHSSWDGCEGSAIILDAKQMRCLLKNSLMGDSNDPLHCLDYLLIWIMVRDTAVPKPDNDAEDDLNNSSLIGCLDSRCNTSQ